jgi:hypothetical protein
MTPQRNRAGGTVRYAVDTATDPTVQRPAWAPLTLVGFVTLVVCTNVAAAVWATWVISNPEGLLALSSRNRYLALTIAAGVPLAAFVLIAFLRLATAFAVCHMIGRAYKHEAYGWFTRYLGLTPESLDGFTRGYAKAEWALVPFFAGSNIVAVISGVNGTSHRRLAVLLSIGIAARLALIWWLAQVFEEQLVDFLTWVQRYQWWAIGISVALVVLVNMRNFRRGAAR